MPKCFLPWIYIDLMNVITETKFIVPTKFFFAFRVAALSHYKQEMHEHIQSLDKQIFEPKLVNIFLTISCSICFVCAKEASH